MLQTWRLDSPKTTWIFSSTGSIPKCVYWGASLAIDEDLNCLTQVLSRPVTHGTLDTYAPLSLCPQALQGWQGQSGLMLSNETAQTLLPSFQLKTVQQTSTSLSFFCEDTELGLELSFDLVLIGEVLKASTALLNHGTSTIRLDWLSIPVLPIGDAYTQLQDFAGRWCGEFLPQTHEWQMGQWVRQSPEGRTSHGHNPTLLATTPTTNHTQGEALAWHLGWSGGHRAIAEELQDGRRQVQFGLSTPTVLLAPNQTFVTPLLYMTYSNQGTNGVLQQFHQVVRHGIVQFPDPERPRPVHYNCWEAVYFNHDLTTLKTIATQAAELGAERFVLDDGWFKGRLHDRAALGDWTVDITKYPQGLMPLIEHIQQLGMSFGLWVEPEMVNPDSDLYRAHPDWVLGSMQQPLGRNQLVLDLTKAGVLDYLLQVLDELLSTYPIDYLKWDHNRILIGATAQQTEQFYQLLAQLRARHPQVEIESCSSGGGRIDYGVLRYTQRVWLSDSNDALERWRMQQEAALILPPEITGSHVGPRVCHTSGRILPMIFRAWVAASRHMGFEMDPRELDAEEAQTLKAITEWWKANRAWYFKGQLHRLNTYDEAILAEMTVAADQSRFVVFIGQVAVPKQNSTRLLRLSGLAPEAHYRIRLAEPCSTLPKLTRLWASPLARNETITLAGHTLMQAGISYPLAFPAHMTVLEAERV